MTEKNYTYEIFDDGYDIYLNGNPHISQREPYAHVYKHDGTYEENALLQIESLTAPAEEVVSLEKLRADLDYVAVMSDLTLPSEEEEE